MQIKDLSKPMTSYLLNETLSKNFGYKIQLENFTDVQLEDARNKLRTKISQFEMNESYDSVAESPEYQKTRMFLDVINQEIFERENSEETDVEDEEDEDAPKQKKSKTNESVRGFDIFRERAASYSVPDSWIDSAINRIKLGETDRAELTAELKLRYDLNESQVSWMLLESEETKAEVIIATKDVIDRITGWLEDVATMKSESLLELLDTIRGLQGSDVAQRYSDTVRPALESIYTALETARQGLTQGLAIVSGDATETLGAPMGGMPGAPVNGAEPPMPGAAGLGAGAGDLGANSIGTGSEPPDAGRMKRESVEYSRKLGMMLSSKKN